MLDFDFVNLSKMPKIIMRCGWLWLLTPLLSLTLSGCAGFLANREGNSLVAEGKVEEGLQKLEEAVQHEPRNAEYKLNLSYQRGAIFQRIISEAELARREKRWDQAQKLYEKILKIDPLNIPARQGDAATIMEKRHDEIVTAVTKILNLNSESVSASTVDLLRPVLLENPRNRQALALKTRIDAIRRKQQSSEHLSKAYQKPITLEFRDAPVRSVFDLIAKISELNFIFDNEVRQDLRVTVQARNSSIEDAIRLLLTTNQLNQKVLNENSILIYPATPQKQREYQPLILRTFYITNADVKAVANTLKSIVKVRDMTLDERLGLIFVRDTADVIRMAERIVALQDVSDPEVMLEVEVLEIKRTRLLELGVQWPSQMAFAPLQESGSPLTIDSLRNLSGATTQVTVGNILVNARKDDQDGTILANPRIRVRNKEKAKILIGDKLPVITTTSTSTGFVSENVNYLDVGLKLEVEPNIYLDDEVAIKINLEVSNLSNQVTSKSGTTAYQVGTRGASTVLRLRDGETQVLAGLINNEDRSTANKVPGLGEIPLLGRLFGSQKDDNQRTEILLSITPRVVRSLQRAELIDAEFDSGTEAMMGTRGLSLQQLDPGNQPSAPAMPAVAPLGSPNPFPSPMPRVPMRPVPAQRAPL